ncbi:MAG: family 16 glycosylhydrolase [Ginsengibacter sp.]
MVKLKFFRFFLIGSFLLIGLSCTKGGGSQDIVIPTLKIENGSQTRGVSATAMQFQLTLTKITTVPVSVNYVLTDGTALASKDYVAASGTVTIDAGKALGELIVMIKGDPTNTRQANPEFKVQLSNPKNCTLGSSSAKGTIITEDGTNLTTDNTGYATPTSYPGMSLTWSDEFSENAPDMNAWNFEIGNGGNGWGNNELEYYTNSGKNVFLSNGNLIIEARKETIGNFNYSSTRMTTQNKKSFKFGRIDIRAKLPVTKGMWPALWMLGSNISSMPWPKCGEIDIMELVGLDPKKVQGTGHFASSAGVHDSRGGGYSLSSEDFSQKFHVFSILWAQDSITWLVDDKPFYTMTKASAGTDNYPFNNDFFFIFNVAVGGDWPGAPDGTTNFPQRMFVDYVRVFQ